ncbi:hypothetical protein Tco_0216277 [Tanacetum coccineum]
MERGFLSQKGSEGRRGVKEKKHSSAQDATIDTDNVVSSVVDVTMIIRRMDSNDVTHGYINVRNTIGIEQGSYDVNSDSNCETTASAIAFLAFCVDCRHYRKVIYESKKLSYARAMIELRADVESKDIIGVVMPKLVSEGFYMCTIRIEYKWKPLKCSSCKVFGYVLNECPKNIVLDVEKNLKNPRQAARYGHVDTKVAVASKEVRNSNPFDVLNSVEKRCDFGLKCGADGGYATNSLLEQWDDNKTGVIITPLR